MPQDRTRDPADSDRSGPMEWGKNEEFWRVAVSSIGDGVILVDADSRVSFMNPVAESLCGWAASEACGKRLSEIFQIANELTGAPVSNPAEEAIRDGRVIRLANHTVLIRPDGTRSPIEDSAAPIVNDLGNISGAVLVFRDVTQQRNAREIKEQLAAIVESSDDIIVSKDLNGIIRSWNRGAQNVLGYSAEEVIGKHISTLMPREQVEDFTIILRKIARGERVDHYETKRRHKDGRIIDVSLTVSPIRDAYGNIIGASKIGRDITEQKRMQAEQQAAERRKDEFLAMLAHELRNPLASISNAVHLFGQLERQEDVEWAKGIVLRQVKHLVRLIDDLLDVSRITRGKISLKKERVALPAILASAIEVTRPLFSERDHELRTDIDERLTLDADPTRLEQMLVNLLTNAAKYTEPGGQVFLSAVKEGSDVVVRVRDSGIGIEPELLTKVFELFVQGDRSAARTEGGLGIGLTLVQKLAAMHGGTVTAISQGVGRGSEFILRLPATGPNLPINATTSQAAKDPPQGRRILVVDDNHDTATSMAKLLTLMGNQVRTANDGGIALTVARAFVPEFILLDIGLPGMDGYEVARLFRQEACCRDATIIAVSGYGQEADRRRSKEAGFDHHLVKPVDYEKLLPLLNARNQPH